MNAQTLCTIFKLNLLKGLEDFDPASIYTYNIALYTVNALLGADTTQYTTSGEITGTGYIAGGKVLTKITPATDGITAFVTFANVTWNPAVFTANSALIYNATTNAAVAVLNFGADKTATSTFTVTFPTANANSAIIKIQ